MKNRPLDRTAAATGISKATIKQIYQTMTEDKKILQLNDALNQELQLTLTHLTKKLYDQLYSFFYEQRNYPTLTAVLRCEGERDI